MLDTGGGEGAVRAAVAADELGVAVPGQLLEVARDPPGRGGGGVADALSGGLVEGQCERTAAVPHPHRVALTLEGNEVGADERGQHDVGP
jgi:hypothetical protein